MIRIKRVFFAFSWCIAVHSMAIADVPNDPIPHSLSLPKVYPDSWVFVQDVNYFEQSIGKYIILDVAAKSNQYKGVVQAAKLSGFAESARRSELYVAETYYSRGTLGERTDVLTIYEKENLLPIAEIVLPGKKRALMIPHKGQVQLTNNEQFILIYNFTPAASVTVVDIDKRQVVNEVPIPGCSLIYPSGTRGFSTLCGNGAMASYSLDEKGEVIQEYLSNVFNDIDNDVLYMTPATINGVSYFASFLGHVQPVDMKKDKASVLPAWSLLTVRDKEEGWKSVDGPTLSADDAGNLYALVHNTKKLSEVWVFDVNRKERVSRIPLQNYATGIEVTKGKHPYLVVLSSGKGIDVYDIGAREFVRNIGNFYGVYLNLIYASQ